MSKIKVLAFDLYGTILDTSSIKTSLKEYFPVSAEAKVSHIVQEWRKYQLEYTWRLNSMGVYQSFDIVTRLSLIHTLKENNSSLTTSQIERVLASYNTLSPFPDASRLIHELPEGVHVLVFSNASPDMLRSTFLDLKIQNDIKHLSVDPIGRYKPDPKVYEFLVQSQVIEYGPIDKSEVYLVSGNPFDIVGAATAGLGSIWVDRGEKGWCDGLGKPSYTVKSLDEVKEILKECRGSLEGVEEDPCCGRG